MITRRVVATTTLVLIAAATAALGIRALLDRGTADPAPMHGMAGMDMGGMDMSADGSVLLTAEQVRTFGVTFGTVELRPIEDATRAVGIITFDETRLASVAAKFDGWVERLHVDFTGQPVRAGQALLDLYSPGLVAAQEELLLAARLQRALEGGTVPGQPGSPADLVAAARRRLRFLDITDAQIDRILERGTAQRTLTLYAPVGGSVITKDVVAGMAISAGQRLYAIADLREVWIEAELREADAARVREGDAATIEVTALPGRPIAGVVEFIQPTLQTEARSLTARIAVPNPEGRLRPGMYATVRITSSAGPALSVPASAVLHTGERTLVFVDLGDDRIAPQEVELGRRSSAFVEVLAGLEPGQRVVTSAQYLLDSESNLAETMRSMMGAMDMSDMGDMPGTDMEPAAADPSRRER